MLHSHTHRLCCSLIIMIRCLRLLSTQFVLRKCYGHCIPQCYNGDDRCPAGAADTRAACVAPQHTALLAELFAVGDGTLCSPHQCNSRHHPPTKVTHPVHNPCFVYSVFILRSHFHHRCRPAGTCFVFMLCLITWPSASLLWSR